MATPPKEAGIVGLKRSPSRNPEHELYSFGWRCGGLIMNGFTYNRTSGAIHPPALFLKGKRYPLVKGFGSHWINMRERLEELIGRFTDSNESNTD